MKIAIIGLGKMGMQFVEKLVQGGIEVIALDRNPDAVKEAASKGATAASTRDDVVSKFGSDKVVVWLMIPAPVVEDESAAWKPILPENSILIDGGNSNFKQSQKRAEEFKSKNISFVDVGTSGGILGMKNGFSFMVGGDKESYDTIVPVLECMSKPSGAFDYFGTSGSGHFVKMVHNAIEYGMMESLAEGYEILKDGPIKDLDLAKVAEVWQHGSIVESTLNGLAEDGFKQNPNMDGIDGVVAQTGEAKWTVDVANELGIKMPATQAAIEVRDKSQHGEVSFATKLLADLRNRFGGHSENPK